ncbi:hypothetical protein, partial [uncultured Muribaculum sp.]
NMNVSSFARRIGVGDQTVRGVVVMRRNKPGYDFILKVVKAFDWLDADWLITGEGNMVRDMRRQADQSPITDQVDALMTIIREKDERIEQLVRENTLLRRNT